MPIFRRRRPPDAMPSPSELRQICQELADDARNGRIAVTPCFLPWGDETPEEKERIRRRLEELIARHSGSGPSQ